MTAAAPPRPGWSIRWQLTRAVLAVVALAWLGTIALTLWYLDAEISEGFDDEMMLVAHTTMVAIETAMVPVVPRMIGIAPEAQDEEKLLLRLSRPGAAPPEGPWTQPGADGFADIDGWRVLRRSGTLAVVEVAQARSWRREEVLETATALLVLLLPMAALLVWGLARGVNRVLGPIEAMAHGIGARSPDDLSPVDAAPMPRELQPLAGGLNSYLARIDDLRQVERRFVANAAHELRTPIAALRARLDLDGPPDVAGAVRLLDDMTRRVERLLQLSRSEAGVGLGRGPTDLLRILRLLIDDTSRRDHHARLRFDDGDLETLLLPLDPDALAILLRNLIDNAVDHGDGAVSIQLRPDRLRITNPTEGTAFHDAAFAKAPGSAGIGLGLSIVGLLSQAMGLRVDKSIAAGQAQVVIHLPAAAPSGSAA